MAQLLRASFYLLIFLSPMQLAWGVGGLHLTPADLLLAVLALLFLLHLALRREWDYLGSYFPWAAALFALIALASMLKSGANYGAGLREVLQFAEYFLAGYLFFLYFLRERKTRRESGNALLGGLSAVVLCGLYHYFDEGRSIYRVSALFEDRNVLGVYLAMMLPFAYAQLLAEGSYPRRIALAVLLVAGAAVLLAGTGALAALAGMVLVAALAGRQALAVTAVALILGAGALSHLPRQNLSVIKEALNIYHRAPDEGSYILAARLKRRQAELNLIALHPGLGVGPGNYQKRIAPYYPVAKPGGAVNEEKNFDTECDEPNSFAAWTVVACETGLAGALLLLVLLAAAFGRALRSAFLQEGGERAYYLGACGAILGAAVAGLGGPLLVRGIAPVLSFFLALSRAGEQGGMKNG